MMCRSLRVNTGFSMVFDISVSLVFLIVASYNSPVRTNDLGLLISIFIFEE